MRLRLSSSGAKKGKRQRRSSRRSWPMVVWCELDHSARIHKSRATKDPAVSTTPATSSAGIRDALADGLSRYEAHLRACDALFPAEGVEEIRLSILAENRWIAKLLRGTIDFTNFRLLVGKIGTLVRRLRGEHFGERSDFPLLPIAFEIDCCVVDPFGRVADRSEKDIQAVAFGQQRDVADAARKRSIAKGIGSELERLERILGAKRLAESRHAVELVLKPEHAQVALTSNGRP